MSEKFYKYINTYAHKQLMKQHTLSEEGIWEIRGEDPNCDFGGSHYQPYLGTVNGKLLDVLKTAVNLPNFWTWGAGGTIKKINVVTINDLHKTASLHEEKEKLQKRIKEIEKELSQN